MPAQKIRNAANDGWDYLSGAPIPVSDINPLDTDTVFGEKTALAVPVKTTWTVIKAFLKTYFDTLYEAARTYTGSIIGTNVSLSTAISELDEALTTVEYPVTAVAAGSWAVESGTVADLDSLADTGMVFIEPAGVSNSFVELQIDNVVHLTNMHAHYRYYSTSGNTNHTPAWEMFNYTLSAGAGAWENTGISVSLNTSLVDLFNKVIENGADYISADANKRVRFRFSHTQAGVGTHRLLLKHVIASKGPMAVVTSQSHNALGDRDLANQHPSTAIAINTTGFTDTSIVNAQLVAEKLDSLSLIDWANPVAVTTTATLTIGKHHICTGTTTDYTVTLPAVSGNAGKLISVEMSGALTKLVTVDANASETIDGALSRVMWARETAVLLCDGVAWTKQSGKTIPMVCRMSMSADSAAFNNSTIYKILFDTASFSSAMADTANKQIVIKRAGNYEIALQVMFHTINTSACSIDALIYKNTALVLEGMTSRGASLYATAIAMSLSYACASGDIFEGKGWYSAGSYANTPILKAGTYFEITERPTW